MTALLAVAHIVAQPDYPDNPGVNPGTAPYFFFACFFAGLVGIGLAARLGDRPFPLTERGRFWVGAAVFLLGVTLAALVPIIRPLLPSLVMPPGRFTPFTLWSATLCLGALAIWVFWGGRKRLFGRDSDPFASYLAVVAIVWTVGPLAFLTSGGFRYSIPWYLAGLSRPLGVGLIFVGLLREQVWLYAELQSSLLRLKETQAQLLQTDKLKALGTLLSGMAHELNNPLSTIQLSVQILMRKHDLPDPALARLRIVEQECDRAARIIRELLVFARQKPPERRRVDLNAVIRAAVNLQAPELELRGIRIASDLQPLPPISGDAHQLQQVLLNVFSNASHAMKNRPDGVLTVRSRQSGGKVVLDVQDTGPGIPPEDLGRVFDPFFTTKGVGQGTGLGLSLSIGIVEGHAGTMQIDNVPGGGARVTLTFPPGDGTEVEETVPPAATDGARARILIIEDEAPLRSLLSEVLTGLGHTVEEAATGRAGIERLESRHYDLIALDLKLPDTDGKAIWRWLGSNRPKLASRVVFMTGDTMSADSLAFLEQTGCPVLRKPLAIDQISRTVASVLAGS